MKGIFEFLAMFSLGKIFTLMRGLIKTYLANIYVDVVDGLRNIYFLLVLTIVAILLFFSGFISLHVALFLYLPWELADKIVLLIILGLVYIFAPIVVMIFLQSRNRWLKESGAKKFLDDTLNKTSG